MDIQTRYIETLATDNMRPYYKVICPTSWTDEQIKDAFRPRARRWVGHLAPRGQHGCADECSDPEIETLVVSHGNERVTDREDDWQARARAAGWTPPAEAPALDLGEPPVFALTLSTRAHRVLTSAGIISVSGLLDRTAGDLLNIRGCGATTVAEIRAALARHGLRLAGDAS